MRRSLLLLTAAATLAGATAAGPASDARQAPTHAVELGVGDALTVTGGPGLGTNAQYFDNFECDTDPDTYCETVLVTLTNPYEEQNAKKGRERANLDLLLTPTTYPAEMDMAIFESDADGTQGSQISQAGTFAIVDCPSGCEQINAVITTTQDTEVVHVLVHVVYFAAAGAYDLDITFTD